MNPAAASTEEVEQLRQEIEVLNRKLAEAHKMASLGRLSAGIVHEINSPVGSILSNNEVILRSIERLKQILADAERDQAPPPRRALEALDVIAGLTAVDKIACERISSVVRSLKTFARVNESDLLKVDLNDLLRNAIKLTATLFRRRIGFETDFGELPEVECFPGLLNQVFLNLLVNASQSIVNEGTVTIQTRLEGDQVHVAVRDTGSGIPPEVQPKIFAAGFTTKPIGEGTGLGLSIAREIVVDTHGGSISFETGEGKGSTFHIRIPIHQPRVLRSES